MAGSSRITPVITRQCDLEFRSGSSDKVYHIWIENVGANHTVKFRYGRRGSTLTEGIKIGPTHAKAAEDAYLKVISEKLGKGYKEMPKGVAKKSGLGITFPLTPLGEPAPAPPGTVIGVADKEGNVVMGEMSLPQLLNEIGYAQLQKLMTDDKWALQQKHDGERMMLFRKPGVGERAFNKSGKKIEPPEEYCSALQSFGDYSFVIDGEACGPVFYVFDILALESCVCMDSPLADRLTLLGMLMRSVPKQDTIRMVNTAFTTKEKEALFNWVKENGHEGVAAKALTAPYTRGRPASGGPALKFKFVASASCRVSKINEKRSVALQMEGGVAVGNVTIPVNHDVPEVGDIVEVQYLYAYKGGSLYQPVYKGKRNDVDLPDRIETLKYKPE